MPTPKPVPGSILPPMEFPKLGGGTLSVGGARENWTLLVVYRGKHCGRCKPYLNKLETLLDGWREGGFDVAVVSADPEAKARADQREYGWSFDLGHDLSAAQMETLGVYVSTPLSPDETDRPFAEPGTYVLRPDGSLVLVAISNGPSARPDLDQLLDGMIFTKVNDRPPRGLG